MTAWYYGDDATELGPVDESALAGLVRSGEISPDSRLRADSTTDWGRAGEVFPGLFAAPQAPASGWTDTKPHAWRRYAARIFDNLVNGGIGWFLIGVVSALVAPGAMATFTARFLKGPFGNLLDALLTLMVALPANALLIGLTGISLGKWIFGVRVLRDGRPIGVLAAFSREIEIWWRALAFGVPLISLATLQKQYDNLVNSKDHITPWDKRQKNTVTYRPDSLASRIWMWAAAGFIVAALVGLRVLAMK